MPSSRSFTIAVVLAGCTAAATGRGNVHVRPQPLIAEFLTDAGGRRPIVQQSWDVTLDDGAPMGLILGAARCGDDMYLLDQRLGAVHHVSLTRGRRVGWVGDSGGGRVFQWAYAVAADCEEQRLYVVHSHGVTVFGIDGLTIERQFEQPPTFENSHGTAVLDAENQTLYVPGLWTPVKGDIFVKPLDTLYAGDRIGYRLDLVNGATSPMIQPLQRGCWSWSPNCRRVLMDQGRDEGGPFWAAAHLIDTRVGVFDEDYRLRRLINVRSPMFVEDGRWVARTASSKPQVEWETRNSVIRRVYAFGDTIATVHSTTLTQNWATRHQLDFVVLLNLHSVQGDGLISDIRLPDLPVGRDENSIYVVSYGPGGRRQVGFGPITISQIRIDPWAQMYQ